MVIGKSKAEYLCKELICRTNERKGTDMRERDDC